MRKAVVLSIVLSTFFAAFGQELGPEMEFMFVDSLGKVIMPDIAVRSRLIIDDELKIMESEVAALTKVDAQKTHFGFIRYYNNFYHIPSLIQGHWLDTEYQLELTHNGQVMRIHILTFEEIPRDTIEFRPGNYAYQGPKNYIDELVEMIHLGFIHLDHTERNGSFKTKSKLIQFDMGNDADICLLNCEGVFTDLDTTLARTLLNSADYFPELFTVNEVPLGILLSGKNQLKVCYFSEEYIKLLNVNRASY